ncbi:C-type lectin domain family 10 member A-like [Anneissia japonica]|uniref:C-type lectin domain family 10 member A-like n=1 Tax=Anneissia japonica TaxID=1529436 RepID=UPI001425852F|nr:C-type lectin domain family 10 member A-like [Anneissia japonica]
MMLTVFVLFVALKLISCACPESWHRFEDNCYHFKYDIEGASWDEARRYCKYQGADIPVISSVRENIHVFNYMSSFARAQHPTDILPSAWLGYQNTGDGWKWIEAAETSIFEKFQYKINDPADDEPSTIWFFEEKVVSN